MAQPKVIQLASTNESAPYGRSLWLGLCEDGSFVYVALQRNPPTMNTTGRPLGEESYQVRIEPCEVLDDREPA